ncbi:MAG TPA: pentapeptide repeat-containing protein [Reyranella sp.]|nr:pentapeptide repeat-containing protein [Reyranella sp.]
MAFAAKARDLEALRGTVVDAATVSSALWFSYITLLFFLLIAVGGVSHRDLFLENPVALPLLSISLPLIGFFALGPALFLVAHAYVLLHFVLLADKVGTFDHELSLQIEDEETRQRLRRQLPINIFTQVLAGPRDIRGGAIGAMLQLVAWMTLVGGPVLLLILFELQFIAFHHPWVSWWHRIAVIADLALLWTLWPSIARGERSRIAWRDLLGAGGAVGAAVSLASAFLVFAVVSYPGEWQEEHLIDLRFIPLRCQNAAWQSLHQVVVAGNCARRLPTSLWSNRVALANFTPPEKTTGPIDLTGRNLDGLVMIGGTLSGANLTDALLRRALLVEVNMQGTNLTTAHLNGATVFQVKARKAILVGAELRGISLSGDFSGANFSNAQLQATVFANARLIGAHFENSQLQGATLQNASLWGAAFTGAEMQGADLEFAGLFASSLGSANLRGANFTNALLSALDMRQAALWRSYGTPGVLDFVTLNDASPFPTAGDEASQFLAGTADDYGKLKQLMDFVPDGPLKTDALARISVLDCSTRPCSAGITAEEEKTQDAVMKAAVSEDEYNVRLPGVVASIICGVNFEAVWLDDMPEALLRAPTVIDQILAPACPVSRTMTAAQKANLEALRPKPKP